MRLFINGDEVASDISPGAPQKTAVPFAIGSGATSDFRTGCCSLRGALRQVRVWNRALTASEVRDTAGRYLTGNEAGLVAYWPLDDGAGQIAQDLGPTGTHLSVGISPTGVDFDPRWIRTSILENPVFTVEEFQILTPPFFSNNTEVYLIDFDFDGDLDVVAASHDTPVGPAGPVQAFRNDGSGRFSDATVEVLGEQSILTIQPLESAVADFNGDGLVDIFFTVSGIDVSPWPGGQNRILIQTADGRLRDETDTRLPIQNASNHGVCAGDIDGDGDIDLFLARPPSFPYDGVRSELFVNDGTGHFTVDNNRLPSAMRRLFTVRCLFVDVDNDGDLDLVLAPHPPNETFVRDILLLNDGTGNFSLAPEDAMPPRYGGIEWESVSMATADFDQNGYPDLLMGTHLYYQEPYLQLLLNNGDGTFRDATDRIPQTWLVSTLTWGSWIKWLYAADFNGDGWPDIVTSSVLTETRLYLNTGRGYFQDASEILPVLPHFYPALVPGDLDNDGDVDLFVALSRGNYLVARNVRPFEPVPPPTQSCEETGRSRIKGEVKARRKGIPGVILTLNGPGDCINTTTTNASGRFRFRGLSHGSYTVTPSKTGCTFTPPHQEVMLASRGAHITFRATCP